MISKFGEDTVPQYERQEPWKTFLLTSQTFCCADFSWTSVKTGKKDGGVHEPGTLASLQRSIQRCLKNNNSNTNILKDQEFAESREVLTARKRDLVVNTREGKSSTGCPRAN